MFEQQQTRYCLSQNEKEGAKKHWNISSCVSKRIAAYMLVPPFLQQRICVHSYNWPPGFQIPSSLVLSQTSGQVRSHASYEWLKRSSSGEISLFLSDKTTWPSPTMPLKSSGGSGTFKRVVVGRENLKKLPNLTCRLIRESLFHSNFLLWLISRKFQKCHILSNSQRFLLAIFPLK